MEAGKLRHYITIQAKTETQNEYGESIVTWEDWKRVYAEVKPTVGREYFAAQQTVSKVSHQIRIRHTAGVTTQHRVSWNGRVFDIESAINLMERDRELVLMCVERVDG